MLLLLDTWPSNEQIHLHKKFILCHILF